MLGNADEGALLPERRVNARTLSVTEVCTVSRLGVGATLATPSRHPNRC